MSKPLFYSAAPSTGAFQLDPEEAHHCLKVLRMKKGDRLCLTDGKGRLFEGTISFIDPKHCEVDILQVTENYGKRNHRVHIAIAPTKNMDRMEWFLEKVTEIGIDEVSFLLCEHSERRAVKMDRLEKIMIAAMKQSFQAFLPKLNPLMDFNEFVRGNYPEIKTIAYLEEPPSPELGFVVEKGRDVLVLIGPEGDFSEKEVLEAKEMGFCPISLGKSRLRTETAGVVVCCLINGLNLKKSIA